MQWFEFASGSTICLIATDPNEVIKNIEAHGFHVQGTKITTEISEAGAAIGGGILVASLAFGPIICGLVAFFVLWITHHLKKKDISLTNLFVVGASASSLPTASLLIYGA